jgi:hypothetical protein
MGSIVMRIDLIGQYEDGPATLSLEVSRASGRDVRTLIVIDIRKFALTVRSAWTLLGFDYRVFAQQLSHLHKALEGTARLVSFDELFQLNFTVEDPKRGLVSIHGNLSWMVPYCIPGNILADAPRNAGAKFTFGGLLIDQSYVPEIAEEVNLFLDRESVDVSSPWECGNRGQSPIL